MGSIGLSYEDFCRCSPSEFTAIYLSYEKKRRTGWAQVKALAICIAAPKLIEKVMTFPWETKEEEHDDWDEEMEGLSDKERFEAAKRKMGAIN